MTDDDKLIDDQGNVDEEELDRRIRELGLDESPSEKAKVEQEKIDDEFESRLKALEDKAQAHKQVRENQQREVNRKQASDQESARGLGIGLSIAYTIIGMPIAGLIIGWLVDKSIGSQTFKSVGVVVGMVVGIAAGLAMLAKSNRPS